MNIPRLVGHRGYMAHYPENSLAGLEAALAAGACYVEFDIQMTARKDFVVLHDDNFLRTAGRSLSVFTASTEELRSISVHEPDRFQEKFFPTPLARLDDCLDLVGEYPAATALVEIKEESLQHWGLAKVMENLLNQLSSHATPSVLISFDFDAIGYAKQHSSINTGWVLHRYHEKHHAQAQTLQPDFLICNQRKIPATENPWRGDWRWMLYDITEPERALEWARRGVELIETADIGNMLEHPVLKKAACTDGL